MTNTAKFDRTGTVKCLKTFGARGVFSCRVYGKNYFAGDTYNVVDIRDDGAVIGGMFIDNCEAHKFEYIDRDE